MEAAPLFNLDVNLDVNLVSLDRNLDEIDIVLTGVDTNPATIDVLKQHHKNVYAIKMVTSR